MPEHEAAALLGTSHFRVLIGREELGFAEVSPLSSEVDPETGEQFAHVVLRRALSRDTMLSTGAARSSTARTTAAR